MSEQTYTEGTPGTAPAPGSAPATTPPFYGKGKSDVQRELPETPEERKNFVSERIEAIKLDIRCWEKAFKRMNWDMRFVGGRNQYPGQKEDDDRYLVNLTYRHIRNRTSAIYAKNPTPVFKLRKKLRYTVWDGKPASLVQASQIMAAPQGQQPQQVAIAQAVMTEAANGQRYIDMLNRVGNTATILIQYYMDEQQPSFKRGMKRMVRRGKSMGVGYVRLGFKRVNGLDPGVEQGLLDMKKRMKHLESLRADMQDKAVDPYCAEVEELQQMIKALAATPEIVLREGLQYDWPMPLDVIPHASCTQLDGFLGADWVTVRHPMTPKKIKEEYKIDIGKNFTAYASRKDAWGWRESWTVDAAGVKSSQIKDNSTAMVFEHYHRPSGLMFTLCDGYPDYLTDPEEPVVDLERFYPIYCYVPNELDMDDDIYPLSDAQLLKHVQREYNRTRENLKQHRWANRPVYLSPDYAFPVTDDDQGDPMVTLKDARAHEIIKVAGLEVGQDPATLVSPLKKAPIDPAAYEVEGIFKDSQRAVGAQASDFGGTSGATATETASAGMTKQGDTEDDIDALEMVLSDLFADSGKVMLKEISPQTAMEIAGPGAVWPHLNRKQIAEELLLSIKGGSSGRPDAAQDLANLERATPLLSQTPGISPDWLAEKVVQLIEPDVDLGEAVASGLPSIIAMNAMMRSAQPAGAAGAPGAAPGEPPTANPTDQGAQGGNNAPAPPQGNQGAQPAFPTGKPQLRAV